ncbi:MAG: MerR family transcriptional regulator [Lachnospiraceae bacterium]|nr:MerR family transcriptional regulator [Lachnospiraceae bacterium]
MKTYRSGWIAQHTGLSRRTMEDYVRRGYIHPRTDSRTNNYREYTWEDIKLAWRIKQLIRIGYSHSEIAEMMASGGTPDFTSTIARKIDALKERQQRTQELIDCAERMMETGEIPPVCWRE